MNRRYVEKCLCPCEHNGDCIACNAGNHDIHLIPETYDSVLKGDIANPPWGKPGQGAKI